ncbi:MAG: DUF424 domain-containing protein [Promethearchaeota archaeon]
MAQVYFKIHESQGKTVVAACDEILLGREIHDKSNNRKVKVSEGFYGGELTTVEKCVEILEKCDNINIIGEKIVKIAIERNLIHASAVIQIDQIPHAIRFRF